MFIASLFASSQEVLDLQLFEWLVNQRIQSKYLCRQQTDKKSIIWKHLVNHL